MQVNKKSLWLFLGAVLIYGVIVSFFTSTVHINYDEELYMNLARSFHYEGKFMVDGEVVDYTCVLYSMIISLAYYFYSPEKILLIIRLINVLLMCSAVFPIFGLAKKVLKDESKAFKVTLLTLILPYMLDVAYVMQEVLAYPLFMWAVYFLYNIFESDSEEKIAKADYFFAALFSVSSFFSKTYLLAIPVIVNMIGAAYWLREKEKKREIFNKLFVYDVLSIIMLGTTYICVLGINDFEKGNNHYGSMLSSLFPITVDDIYWMFLGIVVYLAFCIVNMGILPVETIGAIRFQKENRKRKMWLEDFSLFGLFFMVAEVIVLTFSGEQANGNLPYRFSFRFFHVFVPVVFILFVKYYRKDVKRNLVSRISSVVTVLVCICYFFYVNNILHAPSKQAILDGHLFLLVENITKLILPYADILVMLLLLIILWIESVWKRKQWKYPMKLITAGFVLLWIVSCVQLPVYNNIIAGGREIQNDSIKIAHVLNENDIEFVYYISTDTEGKNFYLQNFYGYIKQPYQVVDNEADLLEHHLKEKKIAVIIQKEELQSLEADIFQEIDLETVKLKLYLCRE